MPGSVPVSEPILASSAVLVSIPTEPDVVVVLSSFPVFSTIFSVEFTISSAWDSASPVDVNDVTSDLTSGVKSISGCEVVTPESSSRTLFDITVVASMDSSFRVVVVAAGVAVLDAAAAVASCGKLLLLLLPSDFGATKSSLTKPPSSSIGTIGLSWSFEPPVPGSNPTWSSTG